MIFTIDSGKKIHLDLEFVLFQTRKKIKMRDFNQTVHRTIFNQPASAALSAAFLCKIRCDARFEKPLQDSFMFLS